MRKYVIMGVQGSGKGTQAKMLAEDLDLVHISVGWKRVTLTSKGKRISLGRSPARPGLEAV